MNQTAYFKIGQLARQTGLTVGTIRYYSELGLLQPAARGENGYRYYDRNAVAQVDFIKKRRRPRVGVRRKGMRPKQAQVLGFTLEEIKQILDVRDCGEKPCDLVQDLLTHKIEQIEIQIEQMRSFKAELEEYRRAWRDNPNPQSQPQEVCPLISSVSLHEKD